MKSDTESDDVVSAMEFNDDEESAVESDMDSSDEEFDMGSNDEDSGSVRLLEPVMEAHEDTYLPVSRPGGGYEFFNRGVTTDETQQETKPCDQWFVDAVMRDLRHVVKFMSDFIPFVLRADAKLPPIYHERAQVLIKLMTECRRLYQGVELFPSAISRQTFCLHLSDILEPLQEFSSTIRALLEEVEEDSKPPTAFAIKIGGIWFRLNKPRPMKKRELPHWHPLNQDGMKPWNKWLNNQNNECLPNGRHKEITQRVPACGIKLLHRSRFMYGAVERSYLQGGRVIRGQKSEMELEEATGEDHLVGSFHFVMSRRNMDCFKSDVRHRDSNGIITLSHLSAALCKYQRRRIPRDVDENWEMVITRRDW